MSPAALDDEDRFPAISESFSEPFSESFSERPSPHTREPLKRLLSRVAAGHASKDEGPGILVSFGSSNPLSALPGGTKPKCILKPLDDAELAVYKSLRDEYKDDPIRNCLPDFLGVVSGVDQSGGAKKFLKLTHLLLQFNQANVLDVKLGVRTFLESETNNPKLRADLYLKMEKLFPNEITAEEKEAKAITKHRYMTLRDSQSTISKLCFRLDGCAGYCGGDVKGITDQNGAQEALLGFVDATAKDPTEFCKKVLEQLSNLRKLMEESSFVSRHEAIGTSVLIVGDHLDTVGVYWIDFAKTSALPKDQRITHRAPWIQGNREDGVFTGIDNLIATWELVAGGLDQPRRKRSGWTKLAKVHAACTAWGRVGSHKEGSNTVVRVVPRVDPSDDHGESMMNLHMFVPPCGGEQNSPHSVCKAADAKELAVYRLFEGEHADDSLKAFVPQFEGLVDSAGSPCEDDEEKQYLCMSNVLRGFPEHLKILELKLGCRTFLELECDDNDLCPELFSRYAKRYPDEVTDAQREAKEITRCQWMTVQDANSTTKDMGFRVESAFGYISSPLRNALTEQDVIELFTEFSVAASAEDAENVRSPPEEAARNILEKLVSLRAALQASAFARQHEMIGTTLLLLADNYGTTSVVLLDFARTRKLPRGTQVTHRKHWTKGSYEDGVLLGVDNLIQICDQVAEVLKHARHSSEQDVTHTAALNPASKVDLDSRPCQPCLSRFGGFFC